jgi:putative hydrolase
MKIFCDYHTHTQHSHGSGTVEDNVQAAIRRGLTSVAITDHSVRHAFYAVKDVNLYLEYISRVREKYKDVIEVKSGLECNLLSLDGELDIPKGYENSFDLILFGFHKLVRFSGMASSLHFMLPKATDLKTIERNTQAYISAIKNYNVNIITHIGYGLPVDKLEIASACASRGVMLEINTKHPEFSVSELKACQDTDVRFILSSDAHSPENVGNVENAIHKAVESGLAPERIFNAKEESR